MSTYTGIRTNHEVEVRVNGQALLPLRLDLCNHSPSGFEFGYGGSGPAQLALAILCEHFQQASDERIIELKQRLGYGNYKLKEHPPTLDRRTWREWLAVRMHQDFKFLVIARLPQTEGFALTDEQVHEAVDRIST